MLREHLHVCFAVSYSEDSCQHQICCVNLSDHDGATVCVIVLRCSCNGATVCVIVLRCSCNGAAV